MELTAREKFTMSQTQTMPNLKDIIGETIKPTAYLFTDYTSTDGEMHKVLSLKTDKGFYRTEVGAFLDKFNSLLDAFGDDLPAIRITGRKSKRGNPYIDFEIAD